jgi:hypothetical protein
MHLCDMVKLIVCVFTNDVNEIKSKAVPQHATEALGVWRYSSYSFSISALDGVNCQRHAPAAL